MARLGLSPFLPRNGGPDATPGPFKTPHLAKDVAASEDAVYVKLLIRNGEMSEWFKEHAWKSIPLARAEAL